MKLPESDRYMFVLSILDPRKHLANLKQTIVEAEIKDNETIVVEKLS